MTAEQKARHLISLRSTNQLLADWELTEDITDPNIATVRGWLMDELEKRNPKGFNEWLESEWLSDKELRNYF